jgi:glycosyltransferase involved in cell wall biosynthesis
MNQVAYDLTRLLLHYGRPTPNGIDRVDIALASHFVSNHGPDTVGACLTGIRPASIDFPDMARIVGSLRRHWAEGDPSTDMPSAIKRRLAADPGSAAAMDPGPIPSPAAASRRLRHRELAYLLSPSRLYRAAAAELPAGSIFLHAYHCPFRFMMRWLSRRSDIKPVFFVHDLLALRFPEYFTSAHVKQERDWLDILAEHCDAAIVNSQHVKDDLVRFLAGRGTKNIPILAAPMPPDPVFMADDLADQILQRNNYFVICGTIEPRKNHLLVLQVWRELARRCGASAPKLLVLGRRGWENENIVDMLDRSRALQGLVIEASGLASDTLARLMANARALLMPSFGEGYGLPIAEALAAGTPVIAADIGVFRQFEGSDSVTFVHPLDGVGWLSAVMRHAEGEIAQSARLRIAPESYFSQLDDFLAAV